jgi:hypothetical protein
MVWDFITSPALTGYMRFEAAWNTNGSSTRTQGGDLNNHAEL